MTVELPKGEHVPEVGMGATKVAGSDCYAYHIISVSPSGNQITVQRARTRRTDSNGLSESQDYSIEPDTNGHQMTLSRRKDGYFRLVGSSMESWNAWHIGNAREYRSPSF